MALTNGTRLGPYEIESALGADGMGDVSYSSNSCLGRPDYRMMLLNVPGLSSGWLGTTTVMVVCSKCFCITRWLPRCRTLANPLASSIWHTSRPERRRSLPNRNLDAGHEDVRMQSAIDFRPVRRLEEQLQRLDEVGSRRFDSRSLARDVEFRAEGYVLVTLAFDDGGQLAGRFHASIVSQPDSLHEHCVSTRTRAPGETVMIPSPCRRHQWH